MKKTIFVSAGIFIFVVVGCCIIGSAADVLSVDELPGAGQTLVLTSNTTIVINETDLSFISGLKILGESTAPITVNIKVDGELNLTGVINCSYATLSVINTGMLRMDRVMVYIIGNSTVSFSNQGNWILSDVNMQVYGGLLYLTNYGTMIGQNLYFKDQYDGTFIHNEGEAKLQDIVLVANGAMGAFHLTNQGTMTLIRTHWDVNYGGTVNLNSLFGELSVNNGSIDVSGASHGQESTVNIVDGNTTWDHCMFVINRGTVNYTVSRRVLMQNCTMQTIANGSIALSNNGNFLYVDSLWVGDGVSKISTQGACVFLNSVCNASGYINITNGGMLSFKASLLQTTSDSGQVLVFNRADITFDDPFIEGVTAKELTSLGSSEKSYFQMLGGAVFVKNEGSITQEGTVSGASDLTLYLLILVIVIVTVLLLLIVFMHKKKKKE